MNVLSMRKNGPLLLLCFGILLGITPVYSVGIALVVFTIAAYYPFSRSGIFKSLATRLVASFLLFNAWVMILATYEWLTNTTLLAVIYIASYALISAYISKVVKQRTAPADNESTGLKDALSMALASLGIIIVAASFYFPQPSLASSIQIMTNGYDNTAHLSLIHTTYNRDGYVYGSYDTVKDQIGWKTLTAYPQGWHLSTAFIWKGLSLPAFTSSSAAPEINLYIASLFLWYFIAAFLLHQVIWYVLLESKLVTRPTLLHIATFISTSIVLQLLVFWGSLMFGFATFLCAIAYMALFVAIILHARTMKLSHSTKNSVFVLFLLSLMCVAAITQAWLFAMPVAALMAFFGFFPIIPYCYKYFKQFRWLFFTAALVTIFMFVPVLIQLFINQSYSTQGTGQINDDGGIFGISTTLAFGIVLLAFVGLSSKHTGSKELRTTLSIIVLPVIGFCTLLFAYQLYSMGHTAYFFTKALALALCLVWLPFACFIFYVANAVQNNLPRFTAISVITISILLFPLMLGQDLSSLTRLLQRNSHLTTENAQTVATAAENGTLKHYRTLVFTEQEYDGDAIGSIFTTMQGTLSRDACIGSAMWTIVTRRNDEMPKYLNECVPTDKIQVITSPDTDPKTLELLDKHITITQQSSK